MTSYKLASVADPGTRQVLRAAPGATVTLAGVANDDEYVCSSCDNVVAKGIGFAWMANAALECATCRVLNVAANR